MHTGSQSQSKAGGLDLGSLTVGGQSVLYGNVGVGLSYPATPQVPLEVSGKTKTTKLEVTSNTFLATDGVGQVGINVPNPRNRLDVGGKIKSSEDVCIALSGGGEKCMATLPSLGPEVVISTTVVDLGWHHICFMVGDVDDDVGTHEKRLFLDPANPGQTAQGKYHWLGVSNSVRSGFFVRCLDLF
ncbi:MAG: hypothetical protein HYT43_01235 [Candidatus Taylorbacteria bacterium]|nr:hypothetical protein [Candidatus Taylorbacteria bacterium]